MGGGTNDPAAWQKWLEHLKQWGIVDPYTAPGMLQTPAHLLPPPPANSNQRFWMSPVSQMSPGMTLNSVPPNVVT